MTNQEINAELGREIKSERKLTNRILKLIILAEDRKVHLERGYTNLHAWLTQEHKYSASSAHRRIQAARLLRSVPTVAAKIEEGAVNLSTLAQAQSMIRKQEQESKQKVSAEEKSHAVSAIENLTAWEAEQALMSLFPENISQVKQDRITVIDPETQRLAVNLSNEAMADLKRVIELLSHSIPTGQASEVIAHVLKEFIKRHDPLEKKQSGSVSRRATKVTIVQRAMGQCTYKNPETGHVCGERFQIERDHVIPRANGGDDSIQNARVLCRAHNQYMSEKILGKKRANRWRERSTGN